jgi:hypothetical protein
MCVCPHFHVVSMNIGFRSATAECPVVVASIKCSINAWIALVQDAVILLSLSCGTTEYVAFSPPPHFHSPFYVSCFTSCVLLSPFECIFFLKFCLISYPLPPAPLSLLFSYDTTCPHTQSKSKRNDLDLHVVCPSGEEVCL